MEYLDIYDENGKHLGKETRDVVHRDALWHNTVHCWLYDVKGNIYFQIRTDEEKLYTTASGHVLAGETIKEGFGREIEEEIGIKVNYEEAKLVDVVTFTMDKLKKDGSIFKDRAFANVYVLDFESDIQDFNFDPNELLGLVKVNAKDTLELLKKESGYVPGEVIKRVGERIESTKEDIYFERFLVNPGETAIGKYGDILNKVIELTETKN